MPDFRSDTVTKPSEGMLGAMMRAEVGDCGYGDDPATNALEQLSADVLGTEDAVFLTSGTLSNQIALQLHTRPGSEVILDQSYHYNIYESGASAQFAQVALNTIESSDGVVTADGIDHAIDRKHRASWCAQPAMLGLENSINQRSGAALSPDQITVAADHAHRRGLRVHLDGARLFNACVARQVDVKQFTAAVDTTSICFSKGLGAPFGSVLAGTREAITRARYYRKLFGAEARQSGFMAAAASYALLNNVDRLADDHALADGLADGLSSLGLRLALGPPDTNIVLVDTLPTGIAAAVLAERARLRGLQIGVLGENLVRFVTHLDVTWLDVHTAISVIGEVVDELGGVLVKLPQEAVR
jgi:threonine aldolase